MAAVAVAAAAGGMLLSRLVGGSKKGEEFTVAGDEYDARKLAAIDVKEEANMRGIDPKDKGTPDDWVERHPDMIRLTGRHPFNSEPPLPQLMDCGFQTPTSLHIVRNHGAVPKLDWSTHTVEISGLVNKPLTITMDDLATKFPQHTFPVLVVCAGNRRKEQNMTKQTIGFNWGPAAAGVSVWKGVMLRDLILACGGAKEGATHVCYWGPKGELPKGEDGSYGSSITLEKAMSATEDVMIAYEMNGERLPPDHGYPVRVLLPGHIGGRTIKWLCRLEVTKGECTNFYHYHDNRVLPSFVDAETADEDGWWYKPEYIINHLNIQSAPAAPHHDETLVIKPGDPSLYTCRGYAYAGGGKKIIRVEMSFDGGSTWELTDLTHPWEVMEPKALWEPRHGDRHWCWAFWKYRIPAERFLTCDVVYVRAWDEGMNTQPHNLSWNVMGMMNNPWFKVNVHRRPAPGGGTQVAFEHPTVPGPTPGGWMNREDGVYKFPGA